MIRFLVNLRGRAAQALGWAASPADLMVAGRLVGTK
jgi:hypothetical protein